MKKVLVILVLCGVFPICSISLHVGDIIKILSYNNLKKKAFHFVGKRIATAHHTHDINPVSRNTKLSYSKSLKTFDKKRTEHLHPQTSQPFGFLTTCIDLMQCCGKLME